jgi:preprotein translocase subunit SecD
MNQYAWWKYIIIGLVAFIGLVYALPNLFGEDPAIQISTARTDVVVDQVLHERVVQTLEGENIAYQGVQLNMDEGRLLVRFEDTETQLQAADVLRLALGSRDYVVALNLAPSTPRFMRSLGLNPMYLGLDLRGGVHFLMEVNMQAVLKQAEESYGDEIRSLLRNARIRYLTVDRPDSGGVRVTFRDAAERVKAQDVIDENLPNLQMRETADNTLQLTLNEQEIQEKQSFALQQNLTTLRNRVNELGVAEPIIQRQGSNRIVVQLPGVQDTARAKDILGATATLEFRLVAEGQDPYAAQTRGRAPLGTRLYQERSGQPILLQRRVMLTGDYITDAASGLDQQSGTPAVFVTLDSKGAKRFENATKDNIGKLMAVVFIENKTETREVDGETKKTTTTVEEVINVATIRDRLSRRFQITGLDSTQEARDLALLLRAGALAAPIEIIEERTVGPSAGQDNINQGFRSAMIAFLLVMVFMAFYYRSFGLVSDLALLTNLVLIVAALSMLQATLTLPGIAGIILTIGMAVDANVLIFERIREELRVGNSPQAAIHTGFDSAFSTILDANVTTLIAAIVLFSFGTGPIKGFAVTLSIGIVTSMFTAIMGARGVINYLYGGRRLQSLPI